TSVFTREKFHIDPKIIQKAQEKYGQEAKTRLVSWQELINTDFLSDREKLEKVNSFFNKNTSFVNDMDLYGVKDYWATPIEFLSRGAGDCEDYAIAKYFSLKMMGIAEEKLRIAYVKALQQNMFHMVMVYYSNPTAEPLILDNLIDTITPASARKDLLPIFTFNGAGLWLAHDRGQGKLAGKSSRLTAWNDLLQRMAEAGI
ncbi:MAG: transglutaminase-like cysteine peptidase, partial [Smithella sp.]|nr:transglutaminase-like cysteine peptidase [Smithella sp.]